MTTPHSILQSLEEDLSRERIEALQNRARSAEELTAITELALAHNRERLSEAVQRFTQNERSFLDVTDRLLSIVDTLNETFSNLSPNHDASEAPVLASLIKRHEHALRLLHDRERPQIATEGESKTPFPHTPLDQGTQSVLPSPQQRNSRRYDDLSQEYLTFFLQADYQTEREDLIASYGARAMTYKARYQSVGDDLDIPWWFIAGLHLLEATYNFDTHLHNGDPLNARTVRVPAGRPTRWQPPSRWEDSAKDALTFKRLNGLTDWSLPRVLWRWERYNGFGYRPKGIATPYLWSFSTIYKRGKYVADGKFDANAVSRQCGCATLLKYLWEKGYVDIQGLAHEEKQTG